MPHPCASSNPPAWCNRKRSKKRSKTRSGRARRVCVRVRPSRDGKCACAKYVSAGSAAARRVSFKSLCGRARIPMRPLPGGRGRGGGGSSGGGDWYPVNPAGSMFSGLSRRRKRAR